MQAKIAARACALALLACEASCSTTSATESKSDADAAVEIGGGDVAIDTTAAPDTTTAADTTVVDVAPEAPVDAGCAVGTWRDFAAGTCVACPDVARPVQCADLDLTPAGSRWDDATKTVTVVMLPGKAEVVSGTLHYRVIDAAGLGTSKTSALAVSGNSLAATIAIDPSTTEVAVAHADIVERCGATSDVHIDGSLKIADGGGFVASFFCGS